MTQTTDQLSYSVPGVARFRVNAFVQQGRVGMVLRTINTDIPKFEELGLPPVLRDVITRLEPDRRHRVRLPHRPAAGAHG